MSNFNNQQNSQYGYAPPGTYGPPGSLPPNPSFGGSYGAPGQVPGGQPFQPPAYNPPQSSSTRPGGYQPPPSMGSGSPYAGTNPPNSLPPPSSANPGFNPAVAAKAPAGRPLFFSTATGAPIVATSVPASVAGPPASMMPPPPPSGSGTMPPPPGGPPLSNAAGPGIAPSVGFGGAVGVMPGPPSLPVGVSGFPRATSMTNMPLGFDTGSGTNLSGMSIASNNPVDPNPTQTTTSSQGAPLPLIDEMDLSIQCNPIFLRPSVSKIVGSQATANACKIPLGIICKPMAGDVGTDNDEIEVVDFGATGIVRCKRCRTYINPYVTWADNGRRWRCNICGLLNDVPSTYFSHLDNSGQRRDKDQRPELSRCSVEFVAPGDYMVRPPQAPVYFFVIDVSENAVQSGMLASMASAIKQSLDDLPGSSRTQIGFITFDSHIHFYNLNSKLGSPQMIVVSEISDVILPLPEDLLVNLKDSRSVVDSLLDSLPSMFKGASSSTSNCLGPALNATKKVIQHMGGKIVLFVSSLPQIGEGALKNRDNPRLLGTDKEHTLLNAEEQWYKTNAIDLSRLQICVDTFLFAPQYTDMATISHLSKFTAGNTYYYPSFSFTRDGKKFESELKHVLLRATAFEAVMRVRATRGLRFSNFYGNYYIRGTDLLALPNCTSDSTFSLDIAYEEAQLSASAITIQAALLYTSSAGERRIRVHTMVLPVTNSAAEMVESFDIDCAMNLLSKQAIDIAQKTGMENARQRINQATIDIMKAAKSTATPVVSHQMPQYGVPIAPQSQVQPVTIPSSLVLLPLYSMSLQKNVVVRGGTDTRIDERAYFQQLVQNMDIEETKVFIYPRMFSIHDITNDDDVGLPSDSNADNNDEVATAGKRQVRLPAMLNLSYEKLSSDGVFLLENGHDMFMWIGRNVNPAIISTLFGHVSLDGVDLMTLSIVPENSDFSSRVYDVVDALREDRNRYMQLHFIKEGDGYAEAYFARYLVEDRANFSGGGLSYTEYHANVTRSVSGLPG